MWLALYEPDIPQNLGSLIRLSACLGVRLAIIEPCGFPLDDKRMRRVAMDYYDQATLRRYGSWQQFLENKPAQSRLILLTTKSAEPYTRLAYRRDDILLLGSESKGAPAFVHDAADARVTIPMQGAARSLNVTLAAAMVVGEALRQTGSFSTKAV